MKTFKIGEKEEPVRASLKEGVLLMPQTKGLYALAWKLKLANGKHVQSEWTPTCSPSIAATLDRAESPIELSILARHVSRGFKLEVARIDWTLVDRWGYIGESTLSGSHSVVGIWVNLKDRRTINVLCNGNVTEELR